MVFALGAQSDLVGVSHECDHPAAARDLPQLTGALLEAGLTPAEIDQRVKAAASEGGELSRLDTALLARLRPDLVITQDLCPVCAVDSAQLETQMPSCPELFSLHGQTLEGVFADLERLAAELDRVAAGASLVAHLRRRLEAVRRGVAGRRRPQVVALEWLDPPFLGGHWVPEMIAIAGGSDALAGPGEPSREAAWEEIVQADPDVLLLMPCGYDELAARRQAATLSDRPGWTGLRAVRQRQVFAVDANGLFSRPGPRLVDGAERLAELLHDWRPESDRRDQPRIRRSS